jgi:hypothetical protein
MKLGFDARDRFRCEELPIGVQDEQIARPVEDDAPARPVLVFIGLSNGAQGGIDRPVASPLPPCFIMAWAVGQAIAIGLGLVDQLGPKPDAKAPPESPMATAERVSQQKVYSDISEVVKHAHVLAAEAEQLRTSIDTEDLGRLQAALAQIKISLERRSLTAAELQALREQIDPLAVSIAAVIQRLEPRLAAIKDRLDQLGPKPDAKAPPESPIATAERASQQKVYSDISEVVKRAHVLAAEAEQLHTSIDAEDLGKPEVALAKVKEGLERRNLTPADLQALREQIVGLD